MERPSPRIQASPSTTSRRSTFSTIRFREHPCARSSRLLRGAPTRRLSLLPTGPLRRMSATSFITNANVRRAMADDWHALRAEAVLQKLDSSPLGLTSREAAQRLSRFGPNELVQTARASPLRILMSQFVDVLVIVLIIAATISASLGVLQGQNEDLYDAVLIIVIVIMNAILGFVQEYRAERSLEALKSLAAPKAHVLREGGVVAVPSRELVPGA